MIIGYLFFFNIKTGNRKAFWYLKIYYLYIVGQSYDLKNIRHAGFF